MLGAPWVGLNRVDRRLKLDVPHKGLCRPPVSAVLKRRLMALCQSYSYHVAFTVPVGDARVAFDESVTGFLGSVASLSEWDLLASSRCHGWARLDLIAHVVAGWQEMLGGFMTLVDDGPTVDAATYWTAFADMSARSDPVEVLMAQRRRTAAYSRPSALLDQLHDVAETVLNGSRTMSMRACRWQGQVFTPGDFLAIWTVENVIHHLDLLVDDRPTLSGLALARATIEALAANPLPTDWPDEQAVLIGSGRLPVPDEAGAIGARLPVLG
jgi:hypothetical protein